MTVDIYTPRLYGGGTPVLRLTPLGQNFVDPTGQIVVRKGITAFTAPKRFATGREADVLRYFDWVASEGLNEVRAFSRVDWTGPPGGGVESGWPYNEAACERTLVEAADRGLRVFLTAHTGIYTTVQGMAAHVRRVDELCVAHDNAILDLYNEPQQNGNPGETNNRIVDQILDIYTPRCPGWSAGVYDQTPYTPSGRSGPTMGYHSPRKYEWPRCFKDVFEYSTGQGPNIVFAPGYPHPVYLDEPPQVEQTVRDEEPGEPASADWEAYAAGSVLFGCGATLHGNPQFQKCEVPTDPAILDCVVAFVRGFSHVPVQRYHGYNHEPDNGALRRYARWGDDGVKYVISVRPFAFGPG